MKMFRFIGIAVFSLIVICRATEALAISECCPAPPTCVPTMACPLQMAGGQTQQPSNKAIQSVSSAAENISQAYRSVTKAIAKARKAFVSAVGSVKDAVVKGVKWPFQQVGRSLGLVADEEDDKNNVTQDNSHSDNAKVGERISKNLTTYTDETQSDYASEYFTVQRRKFIRQQATITLMARMLTLKANLKQIKKIVDEIAGDIEQKESQSGAVSKGMMSTENNEAVVLKSNQELRLLWFKLLSYQRMIEAIKLEFAANQSISGMKLVKNTPSIQSSGKDGGGKITTSGSK